MAEGEFGLWISVLNRAAQGYFTRELAPTGLGPGQQAYLLSINAEEAISQDTLAARLRVDKANVARAVAGLEALGYVERRVSPDDARVRLVSLTPSGDATRHAVESVSRRWIARLKSAVSEVQWAQAEATLKSIALSLADGPEDTPDS